MSVAEDSCQVRMVDASPARTEMISAVAGTVAGCGIGRSPSFPSVLATGVGGVQPSTASDSSLIAPDEPDAAVDPGDAFGVSLPSPAHPASERARIATTAMEPVRLPEVARRRRLTWRLPQGRGRSGGPQHDS